MAQPKILFCKFKDSTVKVLSVWESELEDAELCVRLHNDLIAGPEGELGDEFWFLNQTIKKKTKIIVLSKNKDYPTNHPQFLEKLAPFLKNEEQVNQNKIDKPKSIYRGYSKDHDIHVKTPSGPSPIENEVYHRAKNEEQAFALIVKLQDRMKTNAQVNYLVQNKKCLIHITSIIYSKEEIKDIIAEVNAR